MRIRLQYKATSARTIAACEPEPYQRDRPRQGSLRDPDRKNPRSGSQRKSGDQQASDAAAGLSRSERGGDADVDRENGGERAAATRSRHHGRALMQPAP